MRWCLIPLPSMGQLWSPRAAAVPPAVRIEPASLSLLVEPLAELTRAVRDLERTIALLNTVIPSSYASVAQLAEHQTEDLQVPGSNPLGVISTLVSAPQAAKVTTVAAASASSNVAQVTHVTAIPAPTGALGVTTVAVAPAPTEAAKVTKVAAAPGLADVAGLLRQQVPNRRSFPSSAKPLFRACERYPPPPGISKPKSRPGPPWPPPDFPVPSADYGRPSLSRRSVDAN